MARKIPASLTKAYNRAIKRQGGASERAVKSALTEYIEENPEATVEELREYAIELLKSAGELYGNACSQAAFDLQDEIAREFGTKPPDTGGWYYEPDAESIERTAHYHAGKLVDGDIDGFVKEMAEAARFYAERGANATMIETAKKQDRANRRNRRTGARTHGVTFARVPQGATTCRFCMMLASRGFVYLSEESAGEFDKFHKNCDCRIVPGYPGMELEGYDPEYYFDVYKHPENHPEVNEAINARRRELRNEKKQEARTEQLRMSGNETYSYYGSESDRIADWLSFGLKSKLSPYEGDDNEERANLQTRKDAAVFRALLEQAQSNKQIYYEKTLDDFKRAKDDEKDLFAHAALLVDGRRVVARAERNRENEKSVDLLIDGKYWEVKSPTADGTADNPLGFVEKNLKKARRQFRDDPGIDGRPVRVVFNCRYTTVSDDVIESEIREKMHLRNVGVSEVIMVCKDGELREIN